MRLFIALALHPAERIAIARATRRLRSLEGVRWVTPENLHLTLVFLGELDPARSSAVGEAVAGVAAVHAPVTLELGGIGTFPNAGRPRVIWLGADGGPRLGALQGDLAHAARASGVAVERRPYHSHVTLGRVRGTGRNRPRARSVQAFDGRRLVELGETVAYRKRVVIENVHLLRSERTAEGARYSAILRAPLGGRPHGPSEDVNGRENAGQDDTEC